RAARQRHRFRRPHHPSAHRHRRVVPERAIAAQEPGCGDEGAQGAPVRPEAAGAAGEARTDQRREEGDRLRQPDPQLRPAPVPDGEGPSHEGAGGRRQPRPGRGGHRRVHQELPDEEGGRHAQHGGRGRLALPRQPPAPSPAAFRRARTRTRGPRPAARVFGYDGCEAAVKKKICDTILDAIGDTPMVRINRITTGVIDAEVLVKLETFNPGNSIQDRRALKMIEDAERDGRLKPGGTIIEGTSGNTGMGLAIAAVVKGYRCIFTTTDKQSKEKIDALKAFGAEVIVCPTNVDPEDPRSYYSVSSRLEREIPNAWKANQYDNPSNAQAHYEQTGPEIWEQTDGRVTHLVCGVGTGGTISGAGR